MDAGLVSSSSSTTSRPGLVAGPCTMPVRPLNWGLAARPVTTTGMPSAPSGNWASRSRFFVGSKSPAKRGLAEVGWCALASRVRDPKVALGVCIPLVRGQAVPPHGLGVVLTDTRAACVCDTKGTCMPLVRGQAVPLHGLGVVLPDTQAAREHEPTVALGVCMPLVRGLAVPPDGFGVVLLHAHAARVHDPNVVLGACMPLVRGLAKPTDSGGVVLLDAPAVLVPRPEVVLGLWRVAPRRPVVHQAPRALETFLVGDAHRCAAGGTKDQFGHHFWGRP